MSSHNLSPELKELFNQWGDLSFFEQRKIQLLEVVSGEIPIKDKTLTQLYILNDLTVIKKQDNLFAKKLKPCIRTLSHYNLFKLNSWRVSLILFRPFVDSYKYRIINRDSRPNVLYQGDFQECQNELNQSQYSLCTDLNEKENTKNIVKSFLAGCQPITNQPLVYFNIPHLIVSNEINEVIRNAPQTYNNYFRGTIAEDYGYMENFITLEQLIRNIRG